jgi:hypothetical protein
MVRHPITGQNLVMTGVDRLKGGTDPLRYHNGQSQGK